MRATFLLSLFVTVAVAEPATPSLFRWTTRPIEGHRGATVVVDVVDNGAGATWSRTRDGAPDGNGVAAAEPLARLRAALNRATFSPLPGGASCRTAAIGRVVFESGDRRIETVSPCGLPLDEGTASAIEAAGAIVGTGAACKPAGKPVLRIHSEPLPRPPSPLPVRDASPVDIAVYANGAWTRTDGNPGCLAAEPLKLFKRRLAHARFQPVHLATCRALATTKIVYNGSRGQRIETAEPCGQPIDEDTGIATACIWAALDAERTAEDVLQACRGE